MTRTLLRSWKIPAAGSTDSKEDRGRVLVVGGDREIPGAVLLSGLAALRAGAGKLQIATCQSAAIHLGVAIPEARVLGLAETEAGAIKSTNSARLIDVINESDATLIGPGMMDEAETSTLLGQLLPMLKESALVLDAGAISALGRNSEVLAASSIRGVLTPHAGEMAALTGASIDEVEQDPVGIAENTARTLDVVIALKGAETHIISPEGEHFRYKSGDVGLATSGSGDTLAGIIAGLVARGALPLQAAVWGVFLHGEAGNQLAKKSGRVGYLARELLWEIPPLLNSLTDSWD